MASNAEGEKREGEGKSTPSIVYNGHAITDTCIVHLAGSISEVA